ncbi:MAG TPA: hypothetical protein VNU27_03190 [Candidatus Acidoferrum sp.]|jgi:hypothetical protein|nr:hypothetical protein [Candidatus Acidoferrum sp.]
MDSRALPLKLDLMGGLPADFADTLAQVLEPGHQQAAAGVIEAAARLDDASLRRFLELFAARIRASGAPVRYEELHGLLRVAGRAGAP